MAPSQRMTGQRLHFVLATVLCASFLFAQSPAFAQAGPEITSVRANPATVDEGDVVALQVDARHPDDAPMRFGWWFGDGSTLEPSPNGRHTFTAYLDDGTYEAVARVEDAFGNAISESVRVTVLNVAPRIESIERTGAAIEGTEIGFRLRATDPGDDELTVAWDFGDGASAGPSRNLKFVRHIYEDPGEYTLAVTVDDDDGGSTRYTETIVVGAGFRFEASGALPTRDGKGDSPFLMGMPLVYDGELYRFAGDLGAALSGEPAADRGARCFVEFGTRPPTIASVLTEGTVVGFRGIFPDGLREGTYPVTPVQNRIPFENYDTFEREWAAPGTFFAHAANLQNIDDGRSNMQFHGTGGSVTVQTWEDGRVEISFSADLEESQGPLDIINDRNGLRLPPAAQAGVTGTFQHEIQRSLSGKSGSMNPISGNAYGDWYLCAPRDPLEVEEVVPSPDLSTAEGLANDVPLIDFRDPEISVRFSESIDLDSAVENVVLEWRRPNGASVEVPILVIGEDERVLRLSPLEDLMDGVVYRARIVGGRQGMKGREGEVLAEDEEWLFETILDLSEDRYGVTLATAQVARDAPLVADKPTETRVYLNWREKPHVHPEWQTRYATFDVSVQGASYADKRVRVKRIDLYSAEEEKHALDSVNFYGWQPSAAGEHRLTARVTQVGQVGQVKSFEGTWTVDGYGSARPLRIDYRFATVGSWSAGVPLDARALGHRIARAGAVFTEQTFPVPHVLLTPLGDIHIEEPDEPTLEIAGQKFFLSSLLTVTRRDEDAAEAFRDQVGRTSADVVVMLVPPDVMGLSGYSYSALGSDPRVVAIQVDTGLEDAVQFFASTVAHEVGHAFGLSHGTDCADLAFCLDQSRSDAIEGTRMVDGGVGGWNKSKWSGNAQVSNTPGAVLSLMHPSNLPNDTVFVTNKDYANLQTAMRKLGGGRDDTMRTRGAVGAAPMLIQASSQPGLYVSGWLDGTGDTASSEEPSGELAHISWLRPGIRSLGAPLQEETTAPFVLEARTANGAVTARVPIEPAGSRDPHAPDGSGTIRTFAAFIPLEASTTSVAIVANGRVLAERHASASPPSVAFTAPALDVRAPNLLAWIASDPDGDALSFDVSYTPDRRRWRTVALGLRGTSLSIDPTMLAPGPAPAFRVTATDGFHAATAEATAIVPAGPRVLTTEPADGAEAPPETAVTVLTLGPIDAMGALVLERLDEPAGPVAGRVEALPGGYGIRFVPAEPLAPNATYRAALGTGVMAADGASLEDAHRWSFRTGPVGAERIFGARNLTGAALESAADRTAPDDTADFQQEACAGIEREVWALLIPADATDLSVDETDGACRIEVTSPSDLARVRAFVERAILTNGFFLTSNRTEGDAVRIGMQGRGLAGEAVVVGTGPRTALTWILTPR